MNQLQKNNPITFISSNTQKIREAQAIIPSIVGLSIELDEIQSLDSQEIIHAKIKEALAWCKPPLIVDDTALYLECLSKPDKSLGLPGPLIKWYLETIGNVGIAHMATKLGNVNAFATTTIGYIGVDREIICTVGSLTGKVVQPMQVLSHGWDAIFQPEGYDIPLAAFAPEERNKMSMRALALQKLSDILQSRATLETT